MGQASDWRWCGSTHVGSYRSTEATATASVSAGKAAIPASKAAMTAASASLARAAAVLREVMVTTDSSQHERGREGERSETHVSVLDVSCSPGAGSEAKLNERP